MVVGIFQCGRDVIPAAAAVVFLFPLWGIIFPGAYTLVNLLPFIALGWLLLGAVVAGVLRRRRPATFEALGRVAAPGGPPGTGDPRPDGADSPLTGR